MFPDVKVLKHMKRSGFIYTQTKNINAFVKLIVVCLFYIPFYIFRKEPKKLAQETSAYLNLVNDEKNFEEDAVAEDAPKSASYDDNLLEPKPEKDSEISGIHKTKDKDGNPTIKIALAQKLKHVTRFNEKKYGFSAI